MDITIRNDFHNVNLDVKTRGPMTNRKAYALIKKHACNQADCNCETKILADIYCGLGPAEWDFIYETWTD